MEPAVWQAYQCASAGDAPLLAQVQAQTKICELQCHLHSDATQHKPMLLSTTERLDVSLSLEGAARPLLLNVRVAHMVEGETMVR